MEPNRWPKPKPVERMVLGVNFVPHRYYGWFRILAISYIPLLFAFAGIRVAVGIIQDWSHFWGKAHNHPARLIIVLIILILLLIFWFWLASLPVSLYRGRHPRPDGTVPAGWYPDPAGEARFRYFNGNQWTDICKGGHSPPVALAGWYADPGGSGRRRYFDGRGWTNNYS